MNVDRMKGFLWGLLFLTGGNLGVAMDTKWEPRDLFLKPLVEAVPEILESQDEEGRFGTDPWICRDQHQIFPLAAAWTLENAANPYAKDDKILKAIMDGGDVLIREADNKGMWTFRKKDNSTWGQIYMPWTYSRWIRAFCLIKDAMPAERRERWEKALLRGYEGISKTCLAHVHNIPAHHAMGLYFAGRCLDREDWRKQAADFMGKVVAEQHRDGYWSEHFGPVVAYNFVYTDSLGTYFSASGDQSVLNALRKGALFHANFTYPNGTCVETIDERNGYSSSIRLGNVGFTFTPEGRGYLLRQAKLHLAQGKTFSPDFCASMLLYGEAGDAVAPPGGLERSRFVLGDGDALILREAPWFLCLSAFTCTPPESRWIQDRQNYLSLYHDDVGVFLGGGNTKLQPLLSSFTVGDTSLLKHEPGDENPDFLPEIDLLWTAQDAQLGGDPKRPILTLNYGKERCVLAVELGEGNTAKLIVSAPRGSGALVEAHLPFLRGFGAVEAESGEAAELGETPFEWTAQEAGGAFSYGDLSVSMPQGSRLVWPVLPHNPYKKDGATDYRSGRLVLTVPFSPERRDQVVELAVQ